MGQALIVTGLASMNVQIGTGVVHIPNTTAWNGMYTGYNTATFNVSIPAASSTQWRSDYIVAQIVDPGDATANWAVNDVVGTFSSSSPGALPALPANSIPLAIIRVVPNMTVTTGAGTIVDARVFNGLRGVFPTSSSARPSLTCPNGTIWYESDTHSLGVILNGAYQYLVDTTRSTSNDTWKPLTLQNGFTFNTGGYASYRYADDGRSVKVSARGISPPASFAENTIVMTLPSGYRPINPHEFAVATDLLAYVGSNAKGPRFTVDTAGTLRIWGVAAAATTVSMDIDIPLDL
jgi:hypothetical protein